MSDGTSAYVFQPGQAELRWNRAITLASRPGGLSPEESIEGPQIKRASRDYGVEFIGPLPDGAG